jgi:hypothetical protein
MHGGGFTARAALFALVVLALPATAQASGRAGDVVNRVLAARSQAGLTTGRVSGEAEATATTSVARVLLVRVGADPIPLAVRAALPVAASGQPSSSPVRADGLSGGVTRAVGVPASSGADAPARRVFVAARRLAGAVVSAAWPPVSAQQWSAFGGRQLGGWLAQIEMSGGGALARWPLIRRSLWTPPLAVSPSVRGQSWGNGGLRDIPAWWARVSVATAVGGKVAMPGGSDARGSRAPRSAPGRSRLHAHPPVVGASPGGARLVLPTSPAGAVGSGGIGAGGAAGGALLLVAALWLLQALLSGRLSLDLSPWQSALLSLRLERPG